MKGFLTKLVRKDLLLEHAVSERHCFLWQKRRLCVSALHQTDTKNQATSPVAPQFPNVTHPNQDVLMLSWDMKKGEYCLLCNKPKH